MITCFSTKRLDGYKFPVYSTSSCPGNESEWNKRSAALKCNRTNGYTCLPNEKFTEILEFCYTTPWIWIQEESRSEKAVFDQWEEDDSYFVSTKACEEVENRIKSKNLVVVAGHSGSGKSAIIQHIALKYKKQGWTVERVTRILFEEGVQMERLLLPKATTTPYASPAAKIVAFYAYMSATIPSITGYGYHPSTGVFIAPETGVYVITWAMREASNCRHSTQLVVNKGEIGIIHLHSVSGGDFVGTGVVVTHVNAGDDVHVRTHASWNECYILSDIAGRSSFAGWTLS
uniref:C1q domain-containing protein n=1 Tax=Magallana gigas TaxID=29159 RepID=A0A8W8J8K4_MAGGI